MFVLAPSLSDFFYVCILGFVYLCIFLLFVSVAFLLNPCLPPASRRMLQVEEAYYTDRKVYVEHCLPMWRVLNEVYNGLDMAEAVGWSDTHDAMLAASRGNEAVNRRLRLWPAVYRMRNALVGACVGSRGFQVCVPCVPCVLHSSPSTLLRLGERGRGRRQAVKRTHAGRCAFAGTCSGHVVLHALLWRYGS